MLPEMLETQSNGLFFPVICEPLVGGIDDFPGDDSLQLHKPNRIIEAVSMRQQRHDFQEPSVIDKGLRKGRGKRRWLGVRGLV